MDGHETTVPTQASRQEKELHFLQSLLMNHQQLETSQRAVGDDTAVNESLCVCV